MCLLLPRENILAVLESGFSDCFSLRRAKKSTASLLAATIIPHIFGVGKKSVKGYIFKSPTNPEAHLGDFKKSFKTIMKKAEIKDCNPHDLRRTFGSQLLLEGLDIMKVSKLLGHNSVSTTERHYAFLNLETLHSAVDILDRIMR